MSREGGGHFQALQKSLQRNVCLKDRGETHLGGNLA